MGRDKALLPFRSGVLVTAVAGAVLEAAGSATLVGKPEQYAALGHRVISDLYPGEGPLGGIITALRDTTADWNIVAACDMPALDVEFLARLLDEADTSGPDILMPAGPGGRPEPLCAVYHRRSLPALESAFAGGIRKVTDGASRLAVKLLAVQEVEHFQNVNTPEDWSRHAAK
jgi:molybdopterin-guanine dinucleotide biosynthesis protein A